MNDEQRMQTKFMIYTVKGKICPAGMTAKGCKLRQRLAQLEQDLHIGYQVLENGNLLAPCWFATGDEATDINFNLKNTQTDICADCYRENRKKELQNPQQSEKTKIQTVVFGYMVGGVNNCPAGMTKGTCPLRKELAQTEERYNIGYKELGENILLFPAEHYDAKSNAFHDLYQRSSEICSRCLHANRQNTRE